MSTDAADGRSGGTLPRRIGLWSATGIVIGITIGSGIFRTPAVVAARVPDPALFLAVWMLGGLLALAGALTMAELAAALPESGGIYVFVREAWGPAPAFLFGWAEITVIRGASVAAIASVFGDYLLRSLGVDPMGRTGTAHLIGACAIALTAAANIRGARLGAAITGVTTIAKYAGLLIVVSIAFAAGGAHGASVSNFAAGTTPVEPRLFGLALVSVLWAYDGFADVTFAAGEIASPQRTLPRAQLLGTSGIVLVYLLANAAYLYVTPIGAMAGSALIAADTLQRTVGAAGVTIVAVLVMVSTFGSLNGTVLVAPRIFFAMADDGWLFRSVARVHPRFDTPYVAILVAAALGIGMILTQTFERLADTFVLAVWPFYALAAAGVYRLRRTRPDLPRPYRVVGYPVVPALFISAAVYLIANALVTDPWWTLAVFATVAIGYPVFVILKSTRNRAGRRLQKP